MFRPYKRNARSSRILSDS